MAEVKAGEEVALGADAVWKVIGDFSAIRKWAVLVQDERTEETPEGKVRTLTMQDGRSVPRQHQGDEEGARPRLSNPEK